jgi:hypothetical protein
VRDAVAASSGRLAGISMRKHFMQRYYERGALNIQTSAAATECVSAATRSSRAQVRMRSPVAVVDDRRGAPHTACATGSSSRTSNMPIHTPRKSARRSSGALDIELPGHLNEIRR